MKTRATVALVHLCLRLCATAALSADPSANTKLTAAPGDIALLPCYTDGAVAPRLTTWMKNGREVARGGGSSPSPSGGGQRITVLPDGSASIAAVTAEDAGNYLCTSALEDNRTFTARVLLSVTDSPGNVTTSIGPTAVLPNGTLVAYRGSTVSFICSGSSGPSQRLTWAFTGAAASNDSLLSTSGSSLDFRIKDIQPSDQGTYTCRAVNTTSQQALEKSTELLVYYVPDRPPECMWVLALDPSHVQFQCNWTGAYPAPTLRWVEDQGDQSAGWKGLIFATEETNSLSVMVNRSMLSDGQVLRCTAQHAALAPGDEKSCLFTIEAPYPEGEPLATAQEGESVTLTCSEATSIPPANTTWRRGLWQEDIVPGGKYVLSEEGPVLRLTILNVTKDDEGVYFCHSENLLAVHELEVYLTVKTASSAYTGVIIGIFIAALIVGSLAALAKALYSGRHRICLGGGFGQVEDSGDVMELVESDDEQIFQDAVPQLPPLTNGCHTTLVQIHRIPSSDHEDMETADTSPEQQEETVPTEEPANLVTF